MQMGSKSTLLLRLTWGIIIAVFSYSFVGRINEVVKDENTCVCAYDGFGYYMYLPHFTQTGHLKMTPQWAQALQNEYCSGIFVYQLSQRENGNFVDVYHMGQAFVEAPSYYVGHLFAKLLDYPQDGFSKPYHVAFVANAWLFVLLGVYFVSKLLRLFFEDKLTAILLILLYFGANFWVTSVLSYSLQHIYLFAIIAAMSYYFFRAVRTSSFNKRDFAIAAVLFGLCTVIRPTHALIFLFPFIYLWKYFPSRKLFWWRLSWFPLAAFLWNIPQFLYWKLVGGSWLILNLHTEELILFDPNIVKFLFSFRKGWFIYTPVFLLIIPGFYALRKQDKLLFRALISLTVIVIWVVASWENWWYASSFSSRVLVDIYPLLVLPIGFAFQSVWEHKGKAIAMSIFAGTCLLLAIFQTWQFDRGILHPERMTFEQYAYIFGKTNTEDFDAHRLLIDRADTNWVNTVLNGYWNDQNIEKTELFELKKEFTASPKKDTLLLKIPLFKHLKTDETLLKVELEYESSDTSLFSSLRLETFSIHNCYSWNTLELSQGRRKGVNHLVYKFNLPDIRHAKDQLQVYINNPNEVRLRISKLKITAYSLIRH